MKMTINLYKSALIYVFIMLTLFDMINGYMVIGKMIPENGIASPSQLGRLFAIVLLFSIAFYKKLDATWVFFSIYLLLVEIFSSFIHLSDFGFVFGIVTLSKVIYLFLFYIVLKEFFFKDYNSAVMFFGRVLKWNLLIISFSLIFSTVTGLGNSTYSFGFGTKSFFASGNGLGVYVGVMTLVSIHLKKSKLFEDITLRTLIIISMSIALIGSKAALVFSLLCIINVIFASKYKVLGILIVFLFCFFGSYYLIEAFNILFDVVLKRYDNSSGLVEFLGSGRYDYVADAFLELFSQEDYVSRLLFGGGAFLSFQSPNIMTGYDTLETDIFDILFMYGIFGVLFLIYIYGYILSSVRRSFALFLAALLCILHSLIAGHVIFNGMSSLCLVVLLVFSKIERNRLKHRC